MASSFITAPIFWLILGMGAVTFIPRVLPFIVLKTEGWPAWAKRMLSRVPYAVLGALIFPGILYIQEDIRFGILGGTAAVLMAWKGAPLIAVIGGAIAAVALLGWMV
ncbi:AzlD domain-containing protein [Salisediminibacterium halotolerans]|uniref:Branched-chain amino acid transport protein n=1 Tax=Salisediminibacterium halotolerans TaxID=517425 RepID=A0A1H9VFE0_9BACI|nr:MULTISPECIES: AzlD domain-containing protein [Salisediminibacterium]RLJ74462.1 branched-subunit amino acid transport protein [Actinophytocola xinjiangensis]RPE87445.1 branched-subunit amino acid transport protein [Salisediminibacterium halotolerans]TWG35298.1 branched-subunit amino acid transport protein [Salisediminibacterium halotolerans]SES20271.1 Branched-chain amino acid transport protein [Salisediminibacterium haloalkalitolerans]GEL06780.1 hypothetical protein SHA02_01960 [Salisedimin